MSAIQQAIEIMGGQSKLADAVGISPMAVNKWIKNRVPAERCAAVEKATEGKVTRQQLRPDIFGDTAA